ncbi:hypothetical protein CF326_g855 [Tilletia indica]|nr:hypothetical protein CF326_g855 [Tilletia indica]
MWSGVELFSVQPPKPAWSRSDADPYLPVPASKAMSAIKASNFGLCDVSPNSGKERAPALLHEWGSALDSKLAHSDLTPDSSNDVDWPASWTMYRELVPGPYLMKLAEAATVHHSLGLG